MTVAVRHILALDDEAGDDSACLPLAEAEAAPGEMLADVLTRAGWNLDLVPTVVRVGELYYSRDEWATTALAVNDNVLVISRPAGGAGGGQSSGKAIGAAVALIALAVVAPYIAGPLAGAIGGGAFATNLISTVIVAGGGLLISHFLKPKAAKTAPESPLYNFGLSGNAARPLQMIPVGYGKRLITPDFAAPTYSEFSGSQMTTYGLYAIGCGSYQLDEIRLGQTTIWTSGGGAQGVGTSMTFEVVQPGDDVTLFPVNVITSGDVTGQQLSNSYDNSGWIGPYVANPAGTIVGMLVVDFIWPSGCYYTYKDRTYGLAVTMRVEGRRINDAGAAIGDWVVLLNKTVTLGQKSPIRSSERVGVPSGGRWEVRIGRGGEPFSEVNTNSAVQGTDDMVVSALRAFIDGPNSFDGVTLLAIKATADAGLQAVNNGKVGVIATRILPVWDGSTWQDLATRNPAWAALDIWRNADYSAGLPLARVDLAVFLSYATLWTSNSHTFDHWFTEPSSVVEAIETVLKAGRAVPDIVGDTLSIARDESRGLPRMLFTDREIVRGSVALDYTLYDANLSDGVVGQYLDETTWRLAEVSSAADGVTLAKPAKVELVGVTKRAQAAGLVRFQAAESNYRRQRVSWQVEAEGRLIKRGDLVAISTEEPQTWGAAGEVTGYVYDTPTSQHRLTLSPAPTWTVGAASYWIELRARDGSYFGPLRVTQGASTSIAILNNSDVTSVQSATGKTVAQALYRADSEENPAYVFAAGQARSYRVIVKEGNPSGDYMTLTAVNDDSRVYDVTETGVASLPTVPAFLDPNAAPSVAQLVAAMRQDGLAAVLIATWLPVQNAVRYIAQVSYDDGTSWGKVYEGDQPSLKVQVSPTNLRIRVAAYTDRNVQGAWTAADVTGIDIYVSNEVTNLVVDLDSFRPTALDKAVLEPLFNSQLNELSAFARFRDFEQNKIVVERASRATASGLIAQAQLADGLNVAIEAVTASVAVSLGDLSASITDETTARIGADAALSVRVGELEAISGGADATILSEAVARANADNAIAGQQLTIQATAHIQDDANELAAFVRDQSLSDLQRAALRTSAAVIGQVAVTVADQAQALAILSNTVTVNYAGLYGQIVSEAYARADADTVLTQLYTSLAATVTSNNSTLTASVTSEASARASADSALSTRTSALESTVNTGGTANATLQSRIASEESTRASADTALATRASTLEATVNSGSNGNAALLSRITSEESARASADTTLASRATSLESSYTSVANRVTTVEGAIASGTSGNAVLLSRITSEESTRASADSTLASRASSLESRASTLEGTVNNGSTGVSAIYSRLVNEENTRATADSTLASRATTLESTVNDGSTGLAATRSRVTTAEASLTDVRGQVFGQWAAQIETQTQSGGGTFRKVSGFALIQSGGGGTVVSEFNVAVDRFNILPSASTGTAVSKKPVFTVGTINGTSDIGINGNIFIDGTVTARTLNVGTLSAITASMGTLTAGLIRSSDSKFQVDCDNKRIVIYD
jgi:hypothetical protein